MHGRAQALRANYPRAKKPVGLAVSPAEANGVPKLCKCPAKTGKQPPLPFRRRGPGSRRPHRCEQLSFGDHVRHPRRESRPRRPVGSTQASARLGGNGTRNNPCGILVSRPASVAQAIRDGLGRGCWAGAGAGAGAAARAGADPPAGRRSSLARGFSHALASSSRRHRAPGVPADAPAGKQVRAHAPGVINAASLAAPPAPSPPMADDAAGGAGIRALEDLLQRWRRADKLQHFAHPVTEAQAPGYHTFVAHPMSFDRMQEKVRSSCPAPP